VKRQDGCQTTCSLSRDNTLATTHDDTAAWHADNEHYVK
jgi:hypothetical protein